MPRIRLLIACLILIEAAAILAVIPNFAAGLHASSAFARHPLPTSTLISTSSLVTAAPPVTSAHMPEICGGTMGASHAFVIGCAATMPSAACAQDAHAYLAIWGCVGTLLGEPGSHSDTHPGTSRYFPGVVLTH